jgi:hypothetical protein
MRATSTPEAVCTLLEKIAAQGLSTPITLVKDCLYSTSYEHFDGFKQAISQCLAQTTGRHQAALNSLLTLEFQTFESAHHDR